MLCAKSWRSGIRFEEAKPHGPEFGNIVPRVFTPVLAKHTKSFNLIDTLSVGVDRIQRSFEPLQRQVELCRKTQITDDAAKLIFYSAFIDGKLEAPRSLLPEVHRLYFEPNIRNLRPDLRKHAVEATRSGLALPNSNEGRASAYRSDLECL